MLKPSIRYLEALLTNCLKKYLMVICGVVDVKKHPSLTFWKLRTVSKNMGILLITAATQALGVFHALEETDYLKSGMKRHVML